MLAGYGLCELTPPLGVELAGYGYYLKREAREVLDPLYARAVMLEADGVRALILSCDLLGLSREVCGPVVEHATNALGCREDAVILVSVHTHTGPAVKYHEGCGEVDASYVSRLAGLLCQAADASMRDLSPVTSLESVLASLPGDFLYNRADPDGPVDRMLRGFCIRRQAAAPIAMLNTACHGVFRRRIAKISADFPGAIARRMSARGFLPIYLNGLCGDIDPYRPSDQRMEAFAQTVCDAFGDGGCPLALTLKSGTFIFTLQMQSVTMEEIQQAAAEAVRRAGSPDAPAARVALKWKDAMLSARPKPQEDVRIRYWLLGGVPVLALPFEGFTEIGVLVRRIAGRQDALVLGCAEELLGYLPTRGDIQRGAYAALESTFLYKRLPVLPGEAERLGGELGATLERILT